MYVNYILYNSTFSEEFLYLFIFLDMASCDDSDPGESVIVTPTVGQNGHHISVSIKCSGRRRTARDVLNSSYDIEAERGRLHIKEEELVREKECVLRLNSDIDKLKSEKASLLDMLVKKSNAIESLEIDLKMIRSGDRFKLMDEEISELKREREEYAELIQQQDNKLSEEKELIVQLRAKVMSLEAGVIEPSQALHGETVCDRHDMFKHASKWKKAAVHGTKMIKNANRFRKLVLTACNRRKNNNLSRTILSFINNFTFEYLKTDVSRDNHFSITKSTQTASASVKETCNNGTSTRACQTLFSGDIPTYHETDRVTRISKSSQTIFTGAIDDISAPEVTDNDSEVFMPASSNCDLDGADGRKLFQPESLDQFIINSAVSLSVQCDRGHIFALGSSQQDSVDVDGTVQKTIDNAISKSCTRFSKLCNKMPCFESFRESVVGSLSENVTISTLELRNAVTTLTNSFDDKVDVSFMTGCLICLNLDWLTRLLGKISQEDGTRLT